MKNTVLAFLFLLASCAANVGHEKKAETPVVPEVAETKEKADAEPLPTDSDGEISAVSVVADFNRDEQLAACVRDKLDNNDELAKKGRYAVAVYDRNVLIVGGVSVNDMIETVPLAVIACDGIVEVKNMVVFDRNPSAKALKDADDVIYNEIMNKLAADKRVTAENYRVAVYKGKVYIMGDAADKKEKRDVSGIIRRVKGITNIINYVKVKK